MTLSAATQTQKNKTKSDNNGFNPSFDKLKARRKKIDKIYYRNVLDRKTGQLVPVKNHIKDKPLFSKTTLEIYGYYYRLDKMGNGFLCPGYRPIMETCDCSKSSVTAANDILTEHNIIGIQRTGRTNTIILVPLDGEGYPIESSPEFAVAKALNEKYRKKKTCNQNPTFQESESKKVDIAYYKRQSTRELKKSEAPLSSLPKRPPKSPPSDQAQASADDVKKVRSALTETYSPSISTQFIIRGIIAYGLAFMLWLAVRCQRSDVRSPVKYFCDGVNKREAYNEYDRKIVREGENQEAEANKQHTQDIDNMILAFKERTNMSFEQKREAFLKSISSDEFLVNRYSYMSDEELKNTNEFNNFSI